jgi:hypothetical protein
MRELVRNQRAGYGFVFVQKGSRLLAAVLLVGALTACGGGGDDSAAASSPAPSPASSPATGLTGDSANGSTTLSWMPPTMNDDGTPLTLTGYRIYWGHAEGHYPHSVTVTNPGLTRYVVEQLTPAQYYFVATALSSDGESPPSNVVTLRIL